MVRSLLLTMHGAGSYGGRDFCVIGEGPADAVGHYVNYQGNMVEMNKGKCNPLVMGGAPYMKMDPQTFETDNGHQVKWDGNVWSI